VKANLSREQIKMLRDGGVTQIQPGIESLSTDVLRLMDKGVSALQNINTLRWSHYYNIRVGWNIIWGFPGETNDALAAQTRLIPWLWHLQPPSGGSAIWLERFSPLFFDRRRFAAKKVTPEASYAYIYPRGVDLERAAYFFDYELEGCLPPAAYEDLTEAISVWRSKWESGARPKFTFWTAGNFLQIEDLRDADAPGSYNFEGPLAAIYLACSDRPESAARIKTLIGRDTALEDIEAACKEFARRGLMIQDGKQFLSLALPATGGR
jgi:Radical SAM superfamily